MAANPKRKALLMFTGGLLPVLAFAFVEEYYGPMAGVIAGIVFGVGEMAYEYITLKKIQGITLTSNAMVIVLGAVALWKSDGVMFKLQPAFLFIGFALFMLATSLLKKPFLLELSKKQRPDLPEASFAYLAKLNVRLAICIFVIGLIGIHAAYYWSTPAWAAFKAVGAPALIVIYMVVDIFFTRLRVKR